MSDNVTEIKKLVRSLVEIPSVTSDTNMQKKIINFVTTELKKFQIAKYNKKNYSSIFVSNTSTKNCKIILNAHLDVVPANSNQFKLVEKGNKLYGRGTYDMKAAAAVMILLFKEIAHTVKYPLGLQLVTDEETGGFNGTKYQIQKGVRADFVIAGENTDLAIINRSKGIIWAELSTTGKSAHGAYPWQGKNAVLIMNDVISKISSDYPVPKKDSWKTTINIGMIRTENKALNKVPSNCNVGIDVRYIPEDKHSVLTYLKKLEKNDVKLSILLQEPEHFTQANNEYINTLSYVLQSRYKRKTLIAPHHGGSDLRHFNQVGCRGIEFGPIGGGQHTDNEWVDIKSLHDYYNILKDFLLTIN